MAAEIPKGRKRQHYGHYNTIGNEQLPCEYHSPPSNIKAAKTGEKTMEKTKQSSLNTVYYFKVDDDRATKKCAYWNVTSDLPKFPQLSVKNITSGYLKYNNITICLKDIKAVQSSLLTPEEIELIRSHSSPEYDCGYVNDNIIDLFLAIVTQNSSTKAVSCFHSSAIYMGTSDARQAVVFKSLSRNPALKNANSLLFPVNLNDSHWILIHVDCSETSAQIKVFDSLLTTADRTAYRPPGLARIKHFITKFKEQVTTWEPTVFCDVAEQDSLSACGVFLCYNALQVVHEYLIRPDKMDGESLRKFVTHVILSNSILLKSDRDSLKDGTLPVG